MDFSVRVVHTVQEVDRQKWEELGNGRPFTSYAWYRYAETVMQDSTPAYILLSQEDQMVGRATFWVIGNEPLPISWRPLRVILQSLLRRRPLLVCRSPLANVTGLILPEGPGRKAALDMIIQAAKAEAKKYKGSFLLFDYLNEEVCDKSWWPEQFSFFSFAQPGTRMKIGWADFNEYLAHLKPKVRKHYRQYQREAENLGIRIVRENSVSEIDMALALIRNVERRHHSAPNPWMRAILENAGQVGGIWLTARQDGRLLGCELLLVDNGTQMVTALGMTDDFPHVYFMLGYADIRIAIDEKRHTLNWGSGAFEAKQRLGFELERDNITVFTGPNLVSQIISKVAALVSA